MTVHSLGCDPELFLMNSQGKILSAIGKLGGTKSHPIQVEGMAKGYSYQEDNVLVEYNIPPADCLRSFVKANTTMMDFLNKKVSSELNCHLKAQTSHIMDGDQLEDPRAHIFGCEPDFNVWTLQPNPRPLAKNRALRSAGGHIHIGMPNMSRVDKVMIGRLLDLHLGLWSVTKDTDKRRRELYGKAGSIRFKPYGLEYRTLSNFWLRDEKYMERVYVATEKVLSLYKNRLYDTINQYGQEIQDCINNSDKTAAEHYIDGDWSYASRI